ncbi:MAG: hypothetical protein ACI4FV_11440 [Lachnospiraceae bacterium]
MKLSVLKGIFFGVVLFVALFLFETFMNQGNTDMTAEMPPATYPLVYMKVSGQTVNCLHGYQSEMDEAYMRDTITPLEEGRNLGIEIQKYGADIRGVSYEVRSSDGTRLIENTQLTDFSESNDRIVAYFTIKDLIQQGLEYNLCIQVELYSGQKINYYTRIMYVEDYHVEEKINFVRKFHEDTFDKENASENLALYLEPDSTGDNSTFQKVNIHSSLSQVTWGDLEVKKETEAVVDIKEMMQQTASFHLHYRVSIQDNGDKSQYLVDEYYRIRYTTDRIYLLDFDREMTQIFDETAKVYNADTIFLGIQDPECTQLVECDGGEIVAFVTGNRLFSYHAADNKLALLFSFYENGDLDERTLYDHHKIKILNVDETGNVQFVVYGYMNRGRHEGETGVQVNRFNSSQNVLEELTYIPYEKSPDLLIQEVDKLSVAGNQDKYYMIIDSTAYELDLDRKTCEVIAGNLQESSFKVSDEAKMFVWADCEEEYRAEKLVLKNLLTGRESEIEAGPGEYLLPLGFMDDDLIYGIADKEDVTKDLAGRIFFPMHTIRIQDGGDNILKEYHVPDIYVTDCQVRDNQITLKRVKRDEETGTYQETDDDQIMNSKEETEGKNRIESMVIETLETVVQVRVKDDIDVEKLQLLTPKEVLFEGENKTSLPKPEKEMQYYYVYTAKGLAGVYTKASEAVEQAYQSAGVVMNDTGSCVWFKGNRVTRNQIMKITGEAETENTGQLAVCLNTILDFEGVNRNAQYMLDSGKTTIEILQENIPDIQVLDLTGCSLDSILYYVNQDIPVLVTLQDGSAMLVIGFNELNIVVMDPSDGTVYKIGMNDATEMFEENGNQFITYMRIRQ